MYSDGQVSLIVYPDAGEALTTIKRVNDKKIHSRTYTSDPEKEKISRATTTMRRYIKANGLCLFVTNTFERKVCLDEGIKISNYWIRKLRKRVYEKSFPYIKVLEGTEDHERLHVHIALPCAPYGELDLSWVYGSSDIRRFDRESSQVVAKYLAKSVAFSSKYRRRGFTTAIGFSPKRISMHLHNQDPRQLMENEVGLKHVVCIQDDYGFSGGGRYEFQPTSL